MELQRELAKNHGFTRTIDCGALTLHMFDEKYLAVNTVSSSGTAISLIDQVFARSELSHITRAGLEIIPESPRFNFEMYGFINFTLPRGFRRDVHPAEKLLGELRSSLKSTTDFAGLYIEKENTSLIINSYTQPPITLTLTIESDEAYFDITAPLESRRSSEVMYEAILAGTAAWARTQDFIARSHRHTKKAPVDLLIGNTDDWTVSELELTIETHLGHLALEHPHQTLPRWGDDIRGDDLERLGRHLLSYEDLDVIARRLIEEKREFYGVTGDMSEITQGDIVELMSRVLRPRHQVPPGNSHRD